MASNLGLFPELIFKTFDQVQDQGGARWPAAGIPLVYLNASPDTEIDLKRDYTSSKNFTLIK
jgi:hypothetical protein